MPGIFSTQAAMLKEGDQLHAGMVANSADLGHLTGSREKLASILEGIREQLAQQSVHAASKQESSRQIEQLFRNGSRLITFLRKGVAEHYGTGSEKLVEFGLQPFRGRPRRPAAPVEPAAPVVE